MAESIRLITWRSNPIVGSNPTVPTKFFEFAADIDIMRKSLEELKAKWPDVPTTLQEAMVILDQELPEDVKEEVRNYEEKYRITIKGQEELPEHFMCCIVGGMGMRNGWGLWSDSPLALWFRDRGIWMADDMSGIIGTAYYHHLKGDKTIDDEWMKSERAFYDAYWKASGVTPETTEDMLARLDEWEDSEA